MGSASKKPGNPFVYYLLSAQYCRHADAIASVGIELLFPLWLPASSRAHAPLRPPASTLFPPDDDLASFDPEKDLHLDAAFQERTSGSLKASPMGVRVFWRVPFSDLA